MKIAVIGSSNMDLVTTVTRMPLVGETVEAPSFRTGFGGKGANQAVAMAKLGCDVLMLSRVGDDIFGKSIIENFKSLGMDTRFVKAVSGVPTGVAPIFVDGSGSNSIIIVKGANNCLRPQDIDDAADELRKCAAIVMQLEISLDTVYHAIEFGARECVPVVLNPAPAAVLDYSYVRKVDFFVPNETELASITGMPVESIDDVRAAARKLIGDGVKNVIVTLGGRGSLIINKELDELIPPHPVKAADTTGAGDAFIGCFVGTYAQTGDIISSMKRANVYAALSTERSGAQSSYLTKEEFEKN